MRYYEPLKKEPDRESKMSLTADSVDEKGVALLNCGDDMNALAMCEEFTELKELVGEDWAKRPIGLGFNQASYIDSAAIGSLTITVSPRLPR